MTESVLIDPKGTDWWSERGEAEEREVEREKKARQVAMFERADAQVAGLRALAERLRRGPRATLAGKKHEL